MKCFYFTKDEEEEGGTLSSRESKVSWVRSLSVASSSVDTRKSRSDLDSESRDFTETFEFYEFLTQRRANDLRVFSFSELKMATKGFSRGLMIGEGGFGCVYRGIVSAPCSDLKMEVAVKRLNRHGFQACFRLAMKIVKFEKKQNLFLIFFKFREFTFVLRYTLLGLYKNTIEYV